jgi:hypothetical protein
LDKDDDKIESVALSTLNNLLQTMSLHHNAVALIIRKLKLEREISQKTIQQTQDALRILKFKNPNGSFGKQDNDLKRTFALLEYVVREMEGHKIPMGRLAKAACMKEKDFVKFHQLVGNFRENTSSSKPALSTKDTNKDAVVPQSSLPSLAIKLGPYVEDSNGVALRANRLFENLLRSAKSMQTSTGSYQLQDMKKHQKTYEAACFFLVATRNKTTKSCPSRDRGDEEEKQLDVSALLKVSTDFTENEFKDVLEHIKTLKLEVNEVNDNDENLSLAQKDNLVPKRKRNNPVFLTNVAGKKSKPGPIPSQKRGSDAALEVVKKGSDRDFRSEDHDSLTPHPDYSYEFLKWRRNSIAHAIKAARDALIEESGKSDPQISYEKSLDRAATVALRSNGLVS